MSPLNPEGGSASPQEGSDLSNCGARLYNELDLGNLIIVPRGGNRNVQLSEWDKIRHAPSTNRLLVPLRQDLPLAS